MSGFLSLGFGIFFESRDFYLRDSGFIECRDFYPWDSGFFESREFYSRDSGFFESRDFPNFLSSGFFRGLGYPDKKPTLVGDPLQ